MVNLVIWNCIYVQVWSIWDYIFKEYMKIVLLSGTCEATCVVINGGDFGIDFLQGI
jgi:hypothetical protein